MSGALFGAVPVTVPVALPAALPGDDARTEIAGLAALARSRSRSRRADTHADELETSMMLYIAPDSVDMARAVKDYHPGTGR